MKAIIERLSEFLSERRKIRGGYERCEADPKDVKELEKIIQMICEYKWEPSYEEVVPVQVEVINRSTHQLFSFRPMLYGYTVTNSDCDTMERLETAKHNLCIASQQVDDAIYELTHPLKGNRK